MEREIYQLVYEYSKNKRIIDEEFIKYLVALFAKYYDTSKYVKGIGYQFGKSGDKRVNIAKYYVSDKALVINYEAINYVLSRNKIYERLFSDPEKFFYKNLTIVQALLHELQHAYQNKQSNDKDNTSDEKKIVSGCLIPSLSISLSESMKVLEEAFRKLEAFKVVYKKYYDKAPIERLAQIDSYDKVINIVKKFKSECPNIYDFYIASLYEAMQEGYTTPQGEYSCPTELFLSEIGYQDSWKSLSFYDEDPTKLKDKMFKTYCPMERTRLGLILSDDELKTIGEQVKSSSKYQVTRKKS